ncbi:MAG: hypothetical protein ABI868_25575 [Acidobacteriota bacterium]
MKAAALLVAIFSVTIGVAGIVSPDRLTTARRQVWATPVAPPVAGAVRVAMGLALILFARRSRFPRMLRLLGVLMCLQGLVPQVISADRGRAILEQEVALGATMLRIGAAVALATGVFIGYAVLTDARKS